MVKGLRVVVVMPAYNAERTLRQTVAEVDRGLVDEIVLVDDHSSDSTVAVARELGLHVLEHDSNRGYGANQKTCYAAALALGADIVVMVHPDYQYTPRLLPALTDLVASGLFDIALGSRILGGGARSGGMPLYKFAANRFLTLVQNLLAGMKLSEFHTGYRAFSKRVLETLPLDANDDDFVFDNQMLLQAHLAGYRIGEVTCPTLYFEAASSINFPRSVSYGLGCLKTTGLLLLARAGVYTAPIFRFDGAETPPRQP